MTVAVRLKTPQPPRTRLTAGRDEVAVAPGKLLETAAKMRTSHRVSSIVRSMLARRSRNREARCSTGGRELASAGRAGRCAWYGGASSWLTMSPQLWNWGAPGQGCGAHKCSLAGGLFGLSQGPVTMPHRTLLQMR